MSENDWLPEIHKLAALKRTGQLVQVEEMTCVPSLLAGTGFLYTNKLGRASLSSDRVNLVQASIWLPVERDKVGVHYKNEDGEIVLARLDDFREPTDAEIALRTGSRAEKQLQFHGPGFSLDDTEAE